MNRWLPATILSASLLVLCAIWISVGGSHLQVWELYSPDPTLRHLARLVIVDIRLPRTVLVLAVLAGASLGLSGAALQGLLRNPLADAGIIGISASASLGAVLAFYFGLWSITIGGIAGSLVGLTVLMLLAGRNAGTLTLILAGLALRVSPWRLRRWHSTWHPARCCL